jgi:hypothetical protein
LTAASAFYFTFENIINSVPKKRMWSSRPASSVAGSTDHKDDRECQWQANGESPGNREAECRKQIYLRAQPIKRHAVFSDAGGADSPCGDGFSSHAPFQKVQEGAPE